MCRKKLIGKTKRETQREKTERWEMWYMCLYHKKMYLYTSWAEAEKVVKGGEGKMGINGQIIQTPF